MAQIDFPKILEQLKANLITLAQSTLTNYVSEAKTDAQNMIDSMKAKLERWTQLLAKGDLTVEDFEWLVYSQKDLIEMKALKEAGLAEIRIEQFKGSVINLIIDTVLQIIKI
jgi:hypothetical protein